MSYAIDFFISYASADRAWAEWIAWQLEADGYHVAIDAWDFTAGNDWVHEMQRATLSSERIITVLSPDYMRSAHGEAEWRPFYADDPSGADARLLPVRVRRVEPMGLLRSRVYVDLVSKDAMTARMALLAAARGARGKPSGEPEFPLPAPDPSLASGEMPKFPGQRQKGIPTGISMRADDGGTLRAFSGEVSDWMLSRDYSRDDVRAFQISFLELADNVRVHVRADDVLRIDLAENEGRGLNSGLQMELVDSGPGFNLQRTLSKLEDALTETGLEHGLLRAYRLGSLLGQISIAPNTVRWRRDKSPRVVPSIWNHQDVIPFVVNYYLEAMLISATVYTHSQFENYLIDRRSDAFMDLVFDPLLRPARKFLGIEIVDVPWSRSLDWRAVIDSLRAFLSRNPQPEKKLLLYADTDPGPQRFLRRYCAKSSILMFEDELAARRFLASS